MKLGILLETMWYNYNCKIQSNGEFIAVNEFVQYALRKGPLEIL
jgi:hypothetical protein